MAKRTSPPADVPPGRLAAYELLVRSQPGLERKGASLPYTSVNGNMSSFVDAAGIALRLAVDDRNTFIEEFETALHQAHGTTMKEYVTVPDAALEDLDSLTRWFARSVAYVAGFPPKATQR